MDEGERALLEAAILEIVGEMLLRIIRERGLADADLRVKGRLSRVVEGLEQGQIAAGSIEHYLQRCVTYSQRDLQRRARQEQIADDYPLERLTDPRARDALRVAAARERLALVQRAMDSGMPPNYRRVIEEVVIRGRDRADLARECGVNEATVDRWLSRARAWLRKRVAEFSEGSLT